MTDEFRVPKRPDAMQTEVEHLLLNLARELKQLEVVDTTPVPGDVARVFGYSGEHCSTNSYAVYAPADRTSDNIYSRIEQSVIFGWAARVVKPTS